jgi:hypothetical protein
VITVERTFADFDAFRSILLGGPITLPARVDAIRGTMPGQ